MRFIFLFIFSLLFGFSYSQSITMHWQKNIGGNNNEYAYCTIPTSDGGFVVVGSTNSNKDGDVPQSKAYSGVNGADMLVVKLNYFGEIVWSKTFGGSKDDIATSVIQTKDNGFLIAGTTNSPDGDAQGNGSQGGLLLLKLKTNGSLEWKKLFASGFGFGEVDFQKADGTVKPVIKAADDGGYILAAARANGLPTTEADVWLAKLTSTGSESWTATFGGNQDDFVNDILVCSDGGFLITGSTASSSTSIQGAGKGFFDAYIIKTNANGKLLWQKGFGGTNYDAAYSAVEGADKSYYVVGETNSTDGDLLSGAGLKDAFVVKFSEDGKLNWRNKFGGTNNDGFYSIQKTLDNKLIAFGYSNSKIGEIKPKSSLADAWVMKFELNGLIITNALFGGADIEIARSGYLLSDGNFIVAGNSNSVDGDVEDNHGQADFWVFRTGNPLPANIKAFQISTTPEQYIKLNWETSSELKAKSFGIERSTDDKTYTDLSRVLASGTSTTKKSYEYIDKKPILGKSFYRLKYFDESGKEYLFKTLSTTLSVLANEPTNDNEIEVYPNPVEGSQFSLKMTNKPQNLSFLNTNEHLINIQSDYTDSETLSIKISQTIPSGLYFLMIDEKNRRIIKKVVVR